MKIIDCITFLAAAAAAEKQLKFNAEGKFKIVQLTDMHYGEGDEKDGNTDRLITEILNKEQPDLVVVTGDVVSGYMWDGVTRPWLAPEYSKMFNVITELGYHWATTAGNHDS